MPVKFQLTDQWGNPVSSVTVKISTVQNGVEKPGETKTPGTSSNLCWYDPLTQTYQFNLDTTKLVPGLLTIKATLDYGVYYEENIILR